MARFTLAGKRFYLLAMLLVLLAGGGVVWVERKALLSWYYLRKLAAAGEDDAARWARRTASLGETVVPDLIELLGQDDERACANSKIALEYLAGEWGSADLRTAEAVEQLASAFPKLSCAGRRAALELAANWCGCDGQISPALAKASARLLPAAVRHCAEDLPPCALEIAQSVIRQTPEAETLCAARDLARLAFRSTSEQVRVRAVQLALCPRMEMRKDVAPLLNDPGATVRRAAILAVGEDPEAIETDNLLAWLHDTDPEVRQLCEAALQSEKRGLPREHVQLARLIAHPAWETRLQVLDHLERAEDLDLGVWLRRLTHDPSPAVRIAAIRAACEDGNKDLSDRIDQMARNDPSPTVSEMARHYLKRKRERSTGQFD